jgi:hypothetical protein
MRILHAGINPISIPHYDETIDSPIGNFEFKTGAPPYFHVVTIKTDHDDSSLRKILRKVMRRIVMAGIIERDARYHRVVKEKTDSLEDHKHFVFGGPYSDDGKEVSHQLHRVMNSIDKARPYFKREGIELLSDEEWKYGKFDARI